MKIIDILGNSKIVVEFQDNNNHQKETHYNNFKRGTVKNPYDKSVFCTGYYGVGKYVARKNNKPTPAYISWLHILERCYNEPQKHKHPAYYGIATVCDEWLNYQNYAKWHYENYYSIDGERIHIDKDILIKGNKVYSPETCIFVPQRINMIFMSKQKSVDSDLPNAIYRCKTGFKCSYNGKSLGVFKSLEEAVSVHGLYMKKHIRNVASEYKDKIPEKIYEALLNY